MKMKDIRNKETDHLLHELADQQKNLYTLRTQAVTEKLEDPSQLRKARKTIAQIKTLLRQREIETEKAKASPKAQAPAGAAAQ